MDTYPPIIQRPALLKLVEALGCMENSLRRDECGDWRVIGKRGHIYAIPGTLRRRGIEGFQIYFRGAPEFEEPTTSKAWTYAKEALSFCEVTNDGDVEGMLFLDHLPTLDEANVIRDKIGLLKKPIRSPAEIERLTGYQQRFESRHEVVGEKTADKAEASPPDDAGAIPVAEDDPA